MNNLHKFLSYGFLLVIAIAYPASACYAVSYDCVVVCMNSNMNMTSLANKTIQSIGNDYGEYTDRCTITCEDGVQSGSWAITYNEPLPVDGFQMGGFVINPYAIIPAAIVVTLLVIALWYIRSCK